MKYGLNLSFAVKRWLEPEILAKLCKKDFDVDTVQFTWDLIDPWWPAKLRDPLVLAFKEAFENEGVEIESSFSGLGFYSFAQLLAPSEEQRQAALVFLKRAIDMTVLMGVDVIGCAIGSMSNKESNDKNLREKRHNDAVKLLIELSHYAHKKGIKKFLIEPTPIISEIPHNCEISMKLLEDINKESSIPFELILDWGHVLFEPLLKEEANMKYWLEECKDKVGGIHLQQTDGLLDRHWGFTNKGVITREIIEETAFETGTENLTQYLEIIYPFEETDENVYNDIKKSLQYLRGEIEESELY